MDGVLIVEDEAVLRLTFKQMLENSGLDVMAVEHYGAALQALSERSFGVIVTDVILGGKTGVELLRWVHEHKPGAEVIIITGEPNVETAAEAVRLGAFDYLSKPVTGYQLNRVVRQALERRKLKEERNIYAAGLESYRQELEAIFQSVSEAIITIGMDGVIKRANAAAVALFDPERRGLTGQPCPEIFRGNLKIVCDTIRTTMTTGDPQPEFRVGFDHGDGTERVLLANTAVLKGPAGEQFGAVVVVRDVTRLMLLEEQLADPGGYHQMIGRNRRMREIFEMIENVASTDSTVLITGESGTGKELVAAALHDASARRDGPFIRVNCAALPEDILESELFGHVKGAFTGAVRDRAGRFQAANGGTIFLDEIGDISQRLQLRLLRVLQEREFERVGDTKSIKVDIRIVAASNRDLAALIADGRFREDLFYRLNVVRIDLPPLRERKDDIPILTNFFCRRFNAKLGKHILGFDETALEHMVRYGWPGNIRELENCVERAFVVCHDPLVQVRHLPHELQHLDMNGFESPRPRGGAQDGKVSERDQVLAVLRQTDWNIAKTARILGVARNTVYHRIRHYGLERPESRAD